MSVSNAKNKEPKECRILIVDENKVYAGFVKETLCNVLKNPIVDIAVNVWELRRKINAYKYEFVIADLSVAVDQNEIIDEFEKLNIPVWLWSAGNSMAIQHDEYMGRKKPSNLEELRKILPSMVTQES